jgi:2,3-bisphosphoglycerate-dependent phosphoglycerate mutase
MLTVLLVRHAEPVLPGTHGFDEFNRPLTEIGARDAFLLAKGFQNLEINAVYSSPMLRSIQTVQGFADAYELEVKPMPEFQEHLLTPEPVPNWREVLEQSWSDFDFALPGAETMRETQDRSFYALRLLADHHSSGTIVIGGHGTSFSLILNKIEPGVDYAFHRAMPMPAVYTLEYENGFWEIISGAGF